MRRQSPGALRAIAPVTAVLVASLGAPGADALWLVAAGRNVGSSSLRFATAPTPNWHNAPVLGELVFRGLFAVLQERGLVLANACAAAVALSALAVGVRRQGATAGASALVSLVVIAGALPALAVTRNGLFTLAFFPLLLLLLEDDARQKSPRIWLAAALIALWANCHGGVLIGFALLAVYVLIARRDPSALGALAVAAFALLFLTPQLWDTPQYYVGVLHNEAARMGVGQWAPLFDSWWDIALVPAGLVLVALGVRSIRPWEAVVLIGLAAATIHTARLGTWLLFVAAYPAARAVRVVRPRGLPVAVPVIVGVLAVVGLVRTPADLGSRALAKRAGDSGGAVLADTILAEQVEVAGGKVWVANPLDAFRRTDQRLYLDWLLGKPDGRDAVTHARFVLVRHDTAAGRVAARDRRLVSVARDDQATLYRVAR
jgi:hypothetical protein